MEELTYEQFVKIALERWSNKEPSELPSEIQRFLENTYRNYCEFLDA